MEENRKTFEEELPYEPPELTVLEISEIQELLGPVINCSSYGGSVNGC